MNPPKVSTLPIIDLTDFFSGGSKRSALAGYLREACRNVGFFYLSGHRVSTDLQARLEELSQAFFAQKEVDKMQCRMALAGKAWRGYFPVGGELTSGQPDLKEGIYVGSELAPAHPKVQAGGPMHGANLFPQIPGFRETVLEYMEAVTELGHILMRLLSLSLGLAEDYFYQRYTKDPLILFRIFHYPPDACIEDAVNWGVGEHTDYGLLTILKQDDCGGLQIKSQDRWIEAPPIPNTFICNIGDMLERMTGGVYRSTPHRVRNTSGKERYSYPLFFDPGFDVEMDLIPNARIQPGDHSLRWDQRSVHEFKGTYGEYILSKVARVFPDLMRN